MFVASFVKRLIRYVKLRITQFHILFVLVLTSNLLRQHPETTGLVHRNSKDSHHTNIKTETGTSTAAGETIKSTTMIQDHSLQLRMI
jgi:CBF/Mak21 family